MSRRIYVPRDSGALSLGAEAVARGIADEAARRGIDVTVVRNGSRGLYWLEPLVEVEIGDTRVAYGPVNTRDLPSLFDAAFLDGGAHALACGPTAQIPYLARQQRLTCARVGLIDPVDIADYERCEGFAGLRRALSMKPEEMVQEVADSGLRGRGGAAFPTGIKWRTVLEQIAPQKYIACNADEGDSGR